MKIVIKNLSKKYDKEVILDDISLEIEPGQRVAFIGKSGSGKTTLMRSINGFVTPESGQVLLDDKKVDYTHKKSLRKVRKKIGMVYQLFNLIGRTSVLHNVLTGSLGSEKKGLESIKRTIGMFSKKEKDKARDILKFVKLDTKEKMRVDELSGGQKQRVAIARALMQEPQILLADEPIANLDVSSGKKILKLFTKINQEKNITLIVVIHHIDVISDKYFDRVIALNHGKIAFDGKPNELNQELISNIYNNGIDDEDDNDYE